MKTKFHRAETSKSTRKTVFFIVGRAKSGKSFLARFVSEAASLDEDPRVLLIDCDEVADRDFSRWKSKKVRAMALKTRDDVAKMTGAMTPECRLIMADMAGASQGFMETICADRALLSQYGLEIIPIIVSSDIAELSELTLRWLEIFKDSRKAFLLLNQHHPTTGIVPITALPAGINGPQDVTLIHVPPLDQNVASEVSRLACSVGDVVDGDIETGRSPTLALGLYQTAAMMWASEAVVQMDPLFNYLRSVLEEDAPSAAGDNSSTASNHGQDPIKATKKVTL